MKIILLTATLSPAAGGLSSSVPNLAWRLSEHEDLKVSVVGVTDPLDPAASTCWGPDVYAHDRLGFAAFQYAPAMGRTISSLMPDIIDVQGLWTYPSLVNLKHHRRTGGQYVVTPRGMLDPWARRRSRLKKRVVRAWFEDEHLRHATVLRATAPMEAEHFRQAGLRQPIAIVPNGVITPPDRPPKIVSATRRLLFLGRLHPKKGLRHLLRAWAKIEGKLPNWELVIAGPDEGGHLRELLGLTSKLRLDRVRWFGEVGGAEKRDLYRSADIFILPSHAENFGLVVAESLAQGVPVITTEHTPWSELEQRDCGWWVSLSIDSLITAITHATSLDPDLLMAMGERGRCWMEKEFGVQAVAQQMKDVYYWAAGNGDRPDCILMD